MDAGALAISNRVADAKDKRIAELEAERIQLICDAGAIAYRVCIEAGHADLGQKCEAAIDAALMTKSQDK